MLCQADEVFRIKGTVMTRDGECFEVNSTGKLTSIAKTNTEALGLVVIGQQLKESRLRKFLEKTKLRGELS